MGALLAVIMIVNQPKVALAENAEIDQLANQLDSQLRSFNAQLVNVPIAEQAASNLRELYRSIEKTLVEARQRAANERSSLTSQTIEKLKLM